MKFDVPFFFSFSVIYQIFYADRESNDVFSTYLEVQQNFSKPLHGFMIDSSIHSSEVDQLSNWYFW